jgi:hypothetical protein
MKALRQLYPASCYPIPRTSIPDAKFYPLSKHFDGFSNLKFLIITPHEDVFILKPIIGILVHLYVVVHSGCPEFKKI